LADLGYLPNGPVVEHRRLEPPARHARQHGVGVGAVGRANDVSRFNFGFAKRVDHHLEVHGITVRAIPLRREIQPASTRRNQLRLLIDGTFSINGPATE
jgi:hypothetical protein